MRAASDQRGDKPAGSDGEDGVERGVNRMRRVTFRAKIGALAGEDGFLPRRRNAARSRAPSEHWHCVAPRDPGRLRLRDHRLFSIFVCTTREAIHTGSARA